MFIPFYLIEKSASLILAYT